MGWKADYDSHPNTKSSELEDEGVARRKLDEKDTSKSVEALEDGVKVGAEETLDESKTDGNRSVDESKTDDSVDEVLEGKGKEETEEEGGAGVILMSIPVKIIETCSCVYHSSSLFSKNGSIRLAPAATVSCPIRNDPTPHTTKRICRCRLLAMLSKHLC
eukprot:g18772.t1